ncbi:MAG TPA: FAD-dependent oxidoreductase [Sphingomicrobium sp.]|nr:FAD-dependent oxidoreductase [Sphingomicrobium sp.]
MIDTDVLIVGGGIAGAALGAALGGKRRTMLIEAEDHCGFHSTGRSAAFWLESYGGASVAPLTRASRRVLAENGWLTTRGAIHLDHGTGGNAFAALPGLEELDRTALEARIPGLRPEWQRGLLEPGCADIDVAALHAYCLSRLRAAGGTVRTGAALGHAERRRGVWHVTLANAETVTATTVVNAAGAWADEVARRCAVAPLGITPKRRTMVQLRTGRAGLRNLPLITDVAGGFYFKGESDRSIWLSPHDEVDCAPCDAAPEEIAIATAIARFEEVVDWPVEAVERSWAGLRSFSPDRAPVYGLDPGAQGFFWCVGQGGFGIQTAPAASALAAALLLGETPAHDPSPFDPARFS